MTSSSDSRGLRVQGRVTRAAASCAQQPVDAPGTLVSSELRIPVEVVLAACGAVREEQIALLSRIDAGSWEERLGTVWGELRLRWVVAKTYQHACEHTHDVLSIALRWEMAANRTHP